MKMMGKGFFITFEGGEGAGKTTLIEKLFFQLLTEGFPVAKTREPGGTELGEKIRSILHHFSKPISPYAELSLFLASRAQQIAEIIRPALNEGKILLCDRFNDSTVVYQGVARDLGIEKVNLFTQWICEDLEPQLTIYLDIDPQLGLLRAKQRDEKRGEEVYETKADACMEKESLGFHMKIREGYLALAKKKAHFHVIDASLSFDEVYNAVIDLVYTEVLSRKSNKV